MLTDSPATSTMILKGKLVLGACARRKCCQVYKTVTDGDELFTMQPNSGAKMVKGKTRQARRDC